MKTNNGTFRALFFSLASLGVAGCQSPTTQDWQAFCQNETWAEHGYFDATEGFPIKMAKAYQERCGPDFSKEDLHRYQLGFIKGIKEFCTQEKGYELGRANKPNPDTCPPELQKPFLAGYQRGKGDYHQLDMMVVRQKAEREKWQDDQRPPPLRDSKPD